MQTRNIEDPDVLRRRWFDQPLKIIKNERGDTDGIPDGNGALIALMAVFPLYERYIEFEMETNNANRAQCISDDTGLNEEQAKKFWNVFRDGLLHSGMPFEESRNARREGWTLPKVSLDAKHPPLPEYRHSNNGEDVICLNPWGFVEHVLNKYRDDPELFTRNSDSPLLLLSFVSREIA